MSHLTNIKSKLFSIEELEDKIGAWRENGDKIIFTNGCFDIVHKGHIEVLAKTADLGNKLIIGLNSDNSIKKNKGSTRPIVDEQARAFLLASLCFVDAIILFSEETPIKLIKILKPDVLAKGGDYTIETIIGHKEVKNYNGEVVLVPFIDGYSTTDIIEKIKSI